MSNSFVDTPVKRVRAFKLPPPPPKPAGKGEVEGKPRGGRKGSEPRTHSLTIRISPSSFTHLQALAKKHACTQADMIIAFIDSAD
jgi:hypothetical protein